MALKRRSFVWGESALFFSSVFNQDSFLDSLCRTYPCPVWITVLLHRITVLADPVHDTFRFPCPCRCLKTVTERPWTTECDIFSKSCDQQTSIFSKCIFPKCVFPKCIFPKCVFQKCIFPHCIFPMCILLNCIFEENPSSIRSLKLCELITLKLF